jgi:hypothetical protein
VGRCEFDRPKVAGGDSGGCGNSGDSDKSGGGGNGGFEKRRRC